jgi:hypothetical protein
MYRVKKNVTYMWQISFLLHQKHRFDSELTTVSVGYGPSLYSFKYIYLASIFVYANDVTLNKYCNCIYGL